MNKDEVVRFLTLCKFAVRSNFILELTEKNKKTITFLGYIEDDVIDEIMDLSVKDYCEGPLHDKSGFLGDFWVFGKIIQNSEIYIKLKVKNLNSSGDKQLSTLCISFHFAEKTLSYPFK